MARELPIKSFWFLICKLPPGSDPSPFSKEKLIGRMVKSEAQLRKQLGMDAYFD